MIFEVGPRDGLQNEKVRISSATKLWFIRGLAAAGLKDIEAGSFVRPDRVPQMADTDRVFSALQVQKKFRAWGLIPNKKGFERAVAVGAKHIAVVTAASESFNKKNIGMGIRKSLAEIKKILVLARRERVKVRGYVSTGFGCPFEGEIAPSKVLRITRELLQMGCYQVSIGDTIGVATPRDIERVFKPGLRSFGVPKLAGHFHDTRGTALVNTLRAMDLGVRTFDASAGGLGGCPFAPGATGNLATEDLVYMLDGMGVKTGVNLKKLTRLSLALCRKMRRQPTSRYLLAFQNSCKNPRIYTL